MAWCKGCRLIVEDQWHKSHGGYCPECYEEYQATTEYPQRVVDNITKGMGGW